MRKASGGLVVILLFGLFLGGCKQTGIKTPATGYQPVGIEMSFAGLAGAGKFVIPGSKAKFDVIVKGDDAKSHSLSDGTLRMENLVLESKGITLSKDGREILFDSSIGDGDEYSISASFIGHEDKIRTKRVFLPDFAALRGPEPEDVKQLSVGIDRSATDGEFVPGRPYPIEISVTDDSRRYKTGGVPGLPLDRLKIVTSGLEFDAGRMLITGSLDKALLHKGKYKIEVSYRGRPDLTRTEVISPDFAAIEGPAPINIKTAFIVGDLKKHDAVVPGSELRLDLQVTDKKGRVYRTDWEFPRIPRNRVRVRTKNLDYDKQTGRLRFSGDLRKMMGRRYEITAWYRGRKSKKDKVVLKPDFISGLPLMKEDELVYRGEDGHDGRHGRSAGALYEAAVKRAAAEGTKVARQREGNGEDGGNGADGAKGPSVTIRAREVSSLDGKKRLILMEVKVQGEPARYFLRSWDGAPLRVASYGGKGGDGGNGGDGSRGDEAYFSDDEYEIEPPVYYGGAGGDGGRGGDGGDIRLLVSREELLKAFVLESHEGPGGRKGTGGAGSVSGAQGMTGRPPAGGVAARPNSGRAGADGPRGGAGEIRAEVDEFANEVVQQSPKEINDWILY